MKVHAVTAGGRTIQLFGKEVATIRLYPPEQFIPTRVWLPTSAKHLRKMVGIDCMSCSGGSHLLPDVFTFRCSRGAWIYHMGMCTSMLCMKIHDKFSITGKHKMCSTRAAALHPDAIYPCFLDSPNSMHMHKENAPLTTRLWSTTNEKLH